MKSKWFTPVSYTCIGIALSSCGIQNLKSATTPPWPWEYGIRSACALSSDVPPKEAKGPVICTDADAVNTYITALKFCRDEHNFYEKSGTYTSAFKYTVGLLGTLSGAVMAPITSGNASAAFASFSGAANGMQTSLEDSFPASLNLSKQIAVANVGRKGSAEYVKSLSVTKTPTDRVTMAIEIAYKCSVAADETDSRIISALSASTENPPSKPADETDNNQTKTPEGEIKAPEGSPAPPDAKSTPPGGKTSSAATPPNTSSITKPMPKPAAPKT